MSSASAMMSRDDIPTLLAAGVLAYVSETMLHEAGGHGGVCLAQGQHFLVLAPLWMRCSQSGKLLTAAGPAMNVLAAIGALAVLRMWRPNAPVLGLLLWLSFAFNALVACGYLGVGAATGFGDWAVLFAGVAPQAAWRIPAMLIAIGGYYLCLRVAASLFIRLWGGGASAVHDLRRRALWPAAAAASVACLAEIAGGRIGVLPLLLALGCTALVGFSLTTMDNHLARAGQKDFGQMGIPRSVLMIALATCVAVAFVMIIGPGLTLSNE